MKKLVIAIDGPAGAGKSTIAKAVAEKIGYAYIDTGAMYRAVTWKFVQTGHAYEDEFIGELSEQMLIEFQPKDGINHVFADGVEITDFIRTPEISKLVSPLSAIPRVRVAMVAQQRRMGEKGGVILDGRDIGTVVFPNADLKIFLTATAEERAQRRYKELVEKGTAVDLEHVKADMVQRDYQDSHRPVSPLKQADDAILLDSTGMHIEEVRDTIIKMIEEKEK
ncbi:MAG: (d)CMP kinase [Acidaminococcaceae bacterium]|nr:(d)CMP kinase [Acidaminococcaceae bacterium]